MRQIEKPLVENDKINIEQWPRLSSRGFQFFIAVEI